MDLLHGEITSQIINAFYTVYGELGYGFLEKVYQNSLYLELKRRGFNCRTQDKIDVYYYDWRVGEYYADILVNDLIILELKAAENLCEAHECQLQNYLRATDIEVGLLLNFGKKPQYTRKIFMNHNKRQNRE